MANTEEKQKAIEAVKSFVQYYTKLMTEKDFNGFDRRFIEDIRFIDAEPAGGATWELDVTEYWTNVNGVMHGGAYGVIFDMCTAIAMNTVSKPGYWEFLAGVTRTLNISYLKAIPAGTTIRIIATVIQHGKTMALLRGVIESIDGKTVYATAEHHKVAVPALPEFADGLKEWREKSGQRPKGKL